MNTPNIQPPHFFDHFRLQWDEADFGGASVFRIDPKKIWLPDIEVFNTAVRSPCWASKTYWHNYNVKDPAMMSLSSQYYSGSNALVYPNGEILYIPPVSLKVLAQNYCFCFFIFPLILRYFVTTSATLLGHRSVWTVRNIFQLPSSAKPKLQLCWLAEIAL